jgi:MFS family permease
VAVRPEPGARAPAARPSRRPAWLLEVANLLSGTGNSLVLVALPWLVLERTGSAARAGAVVAASGLAVVVASPIVGAAVDRLGRRTVAIASDLVSFASVVAFPLVDRTIGLTLPSIVVLAVVGAAFDPAAYTARKAMVPDVAAASGIDRTQLTGIHEGVYLAGWTLGPALGAWAIAGVGAEDAIGLAGLGFLGAMLAVRRLPLDRRRGVDAAVAVPPGLRAITQGLGLIRRDRALLTVTVVVMVFLLLYLPTESVLLPVHFQARGEPAGLGLTISALAGGAAIGSFGFGRLSRLLRRRSIAQSAAVLTGIAIVVMSSLPPLPWMMVGAFLLGLGWGPLEPLLTTLVQERVPEEAHGRVFGLQLGLYSALPPAAHWLTGLSVDRVGVGTTYLGVAVLFGTTALVVVALPALADLDRRVGDAPPRQAEPDGP